MGQYITPTGVIVDENDRMPGDVPYSPPAPAVSVATQATRSNSGRKVTGGQFVTNTANLRKPMTNGRGKAWYEEAALYLPAAATPAESPAAPAATALAKAAKITPPGMPGPNRLGWGWKKNA